MKRETISLLMCAFGGPWLHAELTWDTRKAEHSPKASEPFIETSFGFMNSGTTTVEIESVQSSCGCTIPTLAKTLYAPGERGEVLARFNIGELRGVNTKTIRVAVKGEREPAELTWVVNIPELVRISPSPVVWDQNDDTRSKTISLNALPEQPVRVTNVTSTNPFFSAAVETVEEGKRYEITVTRQDIDTPGFALLTIDALVLEKKRTFQVFVQIRPKTKSTPVAR